MLTWVLVEVWWELLLEKDELSTTRTDGRALADLAIIFAAAGGLAQSWQGCKWLYGPLWLLGMTSGLISKSALLCCTASG
jgi:hypothetical protein